MAKNKMKVRLNSSAKAKRWKKGHSCVSNPDRTSYRDAAKNKFFQPNLGSTYLTEEAVQKHNEETEDASINPDHLHTKSVISGDTENMDAKTFQTWATNWTECTNTTFNRVQRYFNSNSALHREVLAVLAAVTEVIKTEGGTESDTEYFATLMTSLENCETIESKTAITYLLSMVIKRTPVAVLQAKFSSSCKLLMNILGENTDGSSPTLLKSCLLCLAMMLQVQSASVWAHSSTRQIYSSILTFITHTKPKVRKTAHQAVILVLKTSTLMEDSTLEHHPAVSTTAKFCLETIESNMRSQNHTVALHVLSLLGNILSEFPTSNLKASCEMILRVMTFKKPAVMSCGMKTLHTMFNNSPDPKRMTSELNAKLISALYDYMPSPTDVQPTKAWLAVMEAAHLNLKHLDTRLCLSHLPKLIASCAECLLTERRLIREHAAKTLSALLSDCLAACVSDIPKDALKSNNPILSIHKTVEDLLGYQYHAAWYLVIGIFTLYFKTMGKLLPSWMTKSLQQMASLRESSGFSYIHDVDKAIGAAVRVMGPAVVLKAVPLGITGENDDINFPRSWLLPVLRDNIDHTELSFFTSYLLPLAVNLRTKSLELTELNERVLSMSYETLQHQIWTMLPGFCTNPTDLATAFPSLAKILGLAITERPELRLDVLLSLRKLVTFGIASDNDTRAVLARFSKNYLPLFFNGFTSEPDEESGISTDVARLAYLQTAKFFFQITDSKLMASFCEKCLAQINDESTSSYKRIAFVDIATAMIPYIDGDKLQKLFDFAAKHLQDSDRSLQKKGYRILEEICATSTVASLDLVNRNLSRMQTLMIKSLSSSHPSSKTARLRCLSYLFKRLPAGPHKKLLDAAIPEAILCTKEVGEKTHKAAYKLLLDITAYIQKHSTKSYTESLDEMVNIVIGGLAGNPHMIAATVATLTRLLYEFRGQISTSVRTNCLETMCVLLSCKTREVLKEILMFLKIYIFVHEDVQISTHLKLMIDSLMSMRDEPRHHLRFVIKELFTKLVKKFSYEMIKSMTPMKYSTVMNNIRKALLRKQKQKEAEKGAEDSEDELMGAPAKPQETIDDILRDSDSDLDEADDKQNKKDKPKHDKKDKTWLKEDGTEDIIDFMDSSASRKITSTQPLESARPKSKHQGDLDFKFAPDGRMIITEPGSDDKGEKIDEEQDLDDLMETIEMGTKAKSRKRKMAYKDAESEIRSTTSSRYKGGGSGIHRVIGKPVTKKIKSVKLPGETMGQEFRAKKAGGDVKKGKQDPYAYIPLKFSNLNKRKQTKVKGRFNSLVHGAKKGARTGAKSGAKNRRK